MKIDSRFKFASYSIDNENTRMIDIVDKLEKGLEMNFIDRMRTVWKTFNEDDDSFFLIDREAEKKIKECKPDYLLCDHVWVCRYSFHYKSISLN